MRLTSIEVGGASVAAVEIQDVGPVPVEHLVGHHGPDLMAYLRPPVLSALRSEVANTIRHGHLPTVTGRARAPYRHPGKIVGIGLNYREHARDLGESAPRDSPVCFLKADHTIIGPGEPIVIPPDIGRVTAEAELGLIMGRECYRVGVAEALDYVAGMVAVLDQTAEDVLLQNPRYLTRAKNYPTFFSFGPAIITLDEVLETCGDLDELEVRTTLNSEPVRGNRVANMTFSPAELISFHSHVMPLHVGDIVSTGTPGAVEVTPGAVVGCELVGFASLANPVASGEGKP